MSLLQNRFLRNIAALQAGGALTSGLNFLASVGLAHVLGSREQGTWIVSMQLYSLAFFVVNVGILQVVVTQVAAASARGKSDKVAAWLAFLIKAYLGMGIFLVIAGKLALPYAVDVWRGFNPSIDPRVATWAWLLIFTPLLDIPRVCVLAALQGTRRMVRLTQVENTGEVLRTFMVVAGAVVTGSPWGPVLGSLTATALAGLVAVELYRRANKETDSYPLPGVRAILRRIRQVPFREGFGQGLRFGVIRQTDALGMKILPPLIIQTFGSSEWVAYFRIAQGIMNVPLMFMQGVSRTALPALSELKGMRDHALFRKLFVRATWMGGTLITLGIALSLPLVPFLVRIMPGDYHRPVWILCLILALGYVPIAYTITLDSFYLLTAQLRMGMIIAVGGFLVSTPLSMFLASQLPRTGAAWGLVGTTMVSFVHFFYVWWYFRHDPELAPCASSS
ncbi:MAG: lipopolysaccharide biosynthesis protein [Planctomycetota bacterium]